MIYLWIMLVVQSYNYKQHARGVTSYKLRIMNGLQGFSTF
jgi:hypothetical protein